MEGRYHDRLAGTRGRASGITSSRHTAIARELAPDRTIARFRSLGAAGGRPAAVGTAAGRASPGRTRRPSGSSRGAPETCSPPKATPHVLGLLLLIGEALEGTAEPRQGQAPCTREAFDLRTALGDPGSEEASARLGRCACVRFIDGAGATRREVVAEAETRDRAARSRRRRRGDRGGLAAGGRVAYVTGS